MASPVPKLKPLKPTQPLVDEAHGNVWDPATGGNKPIGGTKPAADPGILAQANPALASQQVAYQSLTGQAGLEDQRAQAQSVMDAQGTAPASPDLANQQAQLQSLTGAPAADTDLAGQQAQFQDLMGAQPGAAGTSVPGADLEAQNREVEAGLLQERMSGAGTAPVQNLAGTQSQWQSLTDATQPITAPGTTTGTTTGAPKPDPTPVPPGATGYDKAAETTTTASPATTAQTQQASAPAAPVDARPQQASAPAQAAPPTFNAAQPTPTVDIRSAGPAAEKPAVDYSQIPAPPESMGKTERIAYYKQWGVDPPDAQQADGMRTNQAAGQNAWTPTGGIIDDIKGIDTQTVEGTGYDPAKVPDAQQATVEGFTPTTYQATMAPEAEGFTAEGYDPTTVDENLSQAVTRITDQDGILMQRRAAQAQAAANSRGLGNSTMAAQAGQAAVIDAATTLGQGDVQVGMFNADVKNQAAAFLANWKNQSAQFLAAEKNQNGRFNAQQANDAARFTAEAQNNAAAFLAQAKNSASMFNTAEANKMAMYSVEQANLAMRFAADAQNAAKMFNASEFNKASQRYADAYNAALAAQNDAENMSRRDTAMIKADWNKTQAQISGQLQAASMQASGMAAAASANREVAMARLAEDGRQFDLRLTQSDLQFAANLGASQFNQFQTGLNAGMLTDMEPEDRNNWFRNYVSMWNANGGLNFDIDADMYPRPGSGP